MRCVVLFVPRSSLSCFPSLKAAFFIIPLSHRSKNRLLILTASTFSPSKRTNNKQTSKQLLKLFSRSQVASNACHGVGGRRWLRWDCYLFSARPCFAGWLLSELYCSRPATWPPPNAVAKGLLNERAAGKISLEVVPILLVIPDVTRATASSDVRRAVYFRPSPEERCFYYIKHDIESRFRR